MWINFQWELFKSESFLRILNQLEHWLDIIIFYFKKVSPLSITSFQVSMHRNVETIFQSSNVLDLTGIPTEEVRFGHWNSNLVLCPYPNDVKWKHGSLNSEVGRVKPSWTWSWFKSFRKTFYPLLYDTLRLTRKILQF